MTKYIQDHHNIDCDWTKPDIQDFCKAYIKAVKDEVDIFDFQKHQFVTDYAKYLLEYFTMRGLVSRAYDKELKQFTFKPIT